MKTTTVT